MYPFKVEYSTDIEDSDLVAATDAADCSKPLVRMSDRCIRDLESGPREDGNGVVDFPYSLIKACSDRLETTMNPRIALTYKLATSLPFQYGIVPSCIRNRLLNRQGIDSSLARHLANERTRQILCQAFDILGFHLERKRPPTLLVTHDVETEKGLRRSLSLKEIDDDLEVQSAWFLPSQEYSIPRDIAKDLGKRSTIGSHDVKHDGRLLHIDREEDLVRRLKQSRAKLGEVFEREVECFRSPLMQFSRRIASALSDAGYKFDFSLPCWEPAYPPTMTGFGVQSCQGFEVEGVVETPLTLFQDHQVFNVLGMNTHEAVGLWLDQANLVRSFNGDITILVHPDYSFSRDLKHYRELLSSLVEIHSRLPAETVGHP